VAVVVIGANDLTHRTPVDDAVRAAVDASLFSADRFHPSSAGYAVIVDAMLPAVAMAAAQVPQNVR
jgi:lysophospholipase L1-like esterase